MNVKFLKITKDDARLIGYKLKLSPTERAILFEIANKNGASIDELMPLLSAGVSRGNIAVHINSINKKAEAVSGRKLVLFENEKYVLNPYM
jgi:DNA-binding MarR family transcriptional regulator